MQDSALTVTQLNEYVRRALAGDPMLRHVSLRGEVGNFKAYASGHWYFTLKDDTSRIDCTLFRQYTLGLRFKPRDGVRVLVTGAAGLYVQGGKYQFYAETMREDGMGDLHMRYLQLRDALAKEGLFDPARKRPLPLLPRKVGIVTSGSGAALHDIRTVAGRRFPGLELVLRPAQVQGEGAAQDIAKGLAELSKVPGVDVIICGRGGGSMEDLWAFNEEILVRAMAACPVAVISAVGHETDVTLCDFAADMRAATPSAAAELAVPEREALLGDVDGLLKSLRQAALGALSQSVALLSALENRLLSRQPLVRLRDIAARTDKALARLHALGEKQLAYLLAQSEALQGRLDAAGPRQALERGYAIALREGRPVTSVINAQGVMTLLFKDGKARITVVDTERGDPFGKQ